ncbi:hypothetical protein HOY82DRAFT_549901, partial [Tuber indicum]
MGKRREFGRMILRKIVFLPPLLYPLVGAVAVRVLYPGMNCVQYFKPSHLTVPFVNSNPLQGGLTQLIFTICLKRGNLGVLSPSGGLSCLPLASFNPIFTKRYSISQSLARNLTVLSTQVPKCHVMSYNSAEKNKNKFGPSSTTVARTARVLVLEY